MYYQAFKNHLWDAPIARNMHGGGSLWARLDRNHGCMHIIVNANKASLGGGVAIVVCHSTKTSPYTTVLVAISWAIGRTSIELSLD